MSNLPIHLEEKGSIEGVAQAKTERDLHNQLKQIEDTGKIDFFSG